MEIREDEAVDELFRREWHASTSVQHYPSPKIVLQVVRPAKDHQEDERLQTSARFQVTIHFFFFFFITSTSDVHDPLNLLSTLFSILRPDYFVLFITGTVLWWEHWYGDTSLTLTLNTRWLQWPRMMYTSLSQIYPRGDANCWRSWEGTAWILPVPTRKREVSTIHRINCVRIVRIFFEKNVIFLQKIF